MSATLPPLPGNLAAPYPVLLLPVGVQVKFVQPATGPRQLWVRIYPDQLSISTHEAALTADELAAGAQWHASAQDAAQWRGLVARYGAPRAQWLVRQTAVSPSPAPTPAAARWTRPAEARGLPQRFAVLLYRQAATAAEVAAGPVKDLLFPSAHPYAPAAVGQPTTEFLTLYKAVEGADLDLTTGLPVGPDPTAPAAATGAVGGVDSGNRWTVDFDAAVTAGMAVRIDLDNLTPAELAAGFARLVVVGVRPAEAGTVAAATGAPVGQGVLAGLLTDHAYTDGARLVAQGTPTNNTDTAPSGYSSAERGDADATQALLTQATAFSDAVDWENRPDGHHLARALGVADSAMPPLAGAVTQCDTHEAVLLNRALWPATYGYFLDEMLRPLLSDGALDWTRQFFEGHVLARSVVPALRVGAQPYGVLPTTRFSAWEVDQQATDHAYATQLQAVLGQLDAVWTERLNPQPHAYDAPGSSAASAPFTAPPADAGSLLGTLGLDATSGEYYQRYLIGPLLADALAAHASSLANVPGTTQPPLIWANGSQSQGLYPPTANPAYQDFARLVDPADAAHLRQTTAGQPVAAPPLFAHTFQTTFNKLTSAFADEPGTRRREGDLIDEAPLSEDAPVAALPGVTVNGHDVNYLQWLATASFDDIRLENFNSTLGAAFPPPNSLLYRLLRQAVLQAYWHAARPTLPAGSPHPLHDEETFNVLAADQLPRWAWLYRQHNGQERYKTLVADTPALGTYLAAVGALGTVPTARLERLLAEHLDLGSYRLDAWRLAPVAQRLRLLREQHPTGTHLGAFGWLENLRPEDTATLNAAGDAYDDRDNLGYVHAPALPQAATAALLRQGYKSRQLTADPTDPVAARMAVDLSSRRVRAALDLLDGLRGGLSLGALLGQRFERAVQAQTGTAGGRPYASYLPLFRQAFPLSAEQVLVTGSGQTAPGGTSGGLAAGQVVDGAALLRAAAQHPTYPHGLLPTGLPAAGTAFATFVTAELGRLTDELDALGDLGMSEGIYQAARGNVDRAAAVLDAVAKGQFPAQPEVVQPPQRGFTLTQRVLVQLPAALGIGSGWATTATPRAAAAPRLNAWLTQFFGSPGNFTFEVGWRLPDGTWPTYSFGVFSTGLHPIDLLYLVDETALQDGSPLDRLLLHAFGQYSVLTNSQPADPAAVLAVNYDSATATGTVLLRRLRPLLARLRQLLGSARPARPHDLQAPGYLATDNPDVGVRSSLATHLNAGYATLATLVDGTAPLAADDFRLALLFGLKEAAPGLAPGADLPAASRVLRLAVQARLEAAAAALPDNGFALPVAARQVQSLPVVQPTLAQRLLQASALFGPGFRPDVEFRLADSSLSDPALRAAQLAAQQAYSAAADPAATDALLRYYSEQPLALQEWLHGLGAVREPLNHLDKVFLIQSLLNPEVNAEPTRVLRPAQFTATPSAAAGGQDDYWLGLPWPTGPVTLPGGQVLPPYAPPGDALSLVQWLPDSYDPASATQCALWLDEWTETLPLAEQPTAVAFHFDQPNSAAPQALLLVVPPQAQPTGSWTTADLVGAVNETLDLAKKRTVEPRALAATPLAPVLPAVVAPVAQQAVSLTLDLGRPNGTARFNEEPLLVPLNLPQ